ncbi:zona pellucida sperm-binding protein 3 [Kryptolebias marmoratus]|uniref:zona pellucida sperm-binding protein 3 n=1 Tax=Kryptolebias marmoratus TaxID=37003 RepID=UPI000D52F58F|nr:zona pellucida sperm-binding protein 3 [Kryptolebias marmoratus]
MPPLPLPLLFSLCFLLGFAEFRSPTRSPSDSAEDPDGGALAAAGEGPALAVRCLWDSVEVAARARLPDSGVPARLVGLRLGPCAAELSPDGVFSVRAPLGACGSRVTLTEGDVVYTNLLLLSFAGAVRVEAAAVPVLCKHRRRFSVSSGALRPTWTPLVSVHSARLGLDFALRLMTDDWTDERNSPIYFMDQTVNIQASLDHRHPPLRLFAAGCMATLTPDVTSEPRYAFIDRQGCFTDSLLSGSGSRFLPRVDDQLLRIQLEPFLFHKDRRHAIYITCHLEAVPVSERDPEKKACSFLNGSWRSADGEDGVCESCSGAETSHRRARRSRRSHRNNELHGEATLGPIIFVPERGAAAEERGNLYRGR